MRPTRRRSRAPSALRGARRRALDWFDAVFMRKDPPFDMAFFFATHLLGLIDPARTLVINDPRGLRDANEKLYALNFPDVIPPSLVTSNMPRLKQFLDELGGEMIVKPLDGAGGAGVFHLHRGDRNLNAILESATDYGRRPIMAQRYLPEIRQGDKRIIVLDGEPLGAVLRVPREDETRGNIHVGGGTVKSAGHRRATARSAPASPRACAPTASGSSASTSSATGSPRSTSPAPPASRRSTPSTASTSKPGHRLRRAARRGATARIADRRSLIAAMCDDIGGAGTA